MNLAGGLKTVNFKPNCRTNDKGHLQYVAVQQCDDLCFPSQNYLLLVFGEVGKQHLRLLKSCSTECVSGAEYYPELDARFDPNKCYGAIGIVMWVGHEPCMVK
jgi:hypothetical protein